MSCADDVLTVGLSAPSPGAAAAAIDLSPVPPPQSGWSMAPINPAGAAQSGCDPRVSAFAVAAPTPSRLAISYTAAASAPCAAGSCATAPLPPAPQGSRPLAVGRGHVCALRTDGTLACAGYNDAGQAAPANSPTYVYTPVVAFQSTTPAVKKVASVAVGGSIGGTTSYTLAVLEDGSALGFGGNDNGQVGQRLLANYC